MVDVLFVIKFLIDMTFSLNVCIHINVKNNFLMSIISKKIMRVFLIILIYILIS